MDSLKIKGPRQNSDSGNNVPQFEETVKKKDADYMDAVNRGDMETTQKMVDEAARAAGYTVNGYHRNM